MNKKIDPSTINGWGHDADPANEPTYPMKKYNGDDHKQSDWERPTQQTQKVEMLKSTERPTLSAVYGTGAPPHWLSGMIRRIAFRYSENQYRHWLPLLLADRINIIEGIVEDVISGRFPNFFKERGWQSMAKHRPSRFIVRIAVRAALIMLFIYVIKNRREDKKLLSFK